MSRYTNANLQNSKLNDALRATILEGADLSSQAARIGIMLAWGVASFVVALKIFRWN
jgi:hypothetical protein